MTVCRTAVEPFFSVSWGSGLSDHMQGGGFDVFLRYSFPAFSSRAASGAIEQRPARKLGAECPSSFIARRNLVPEALVLASQVIPGRADFLALRPSHAAVAGKLKLARLRRPVSGRPPQTLPTIQALPVDPHCISTMALMASGNGKPLAAFCADPWSCPVRDGRDAVGTMTEGATSAHALPASRGAPYSPEVRCRPEPSLRRGPTLNVTHPP
jgi:hypothetical protein